MSNFNNGQNPPDNQQPSFDLGEISSNLPHHWEDEDRYNEQNWSNLGTSGSFSGRSGWGADAVYEARDRGLIRKAKKGYFYCPLCGNDKFSIAGHNKGYTCFGSGSKCGNDTEGITLKAIELLGGSISPSNHYFEKQPKQKQENYPAYFPLLEGLSDRFEKQPHELTWGIFFLLYLHGLAVNLLLYFELYFTTIVLQKKIEVPPHQKNFTRIRQKVQVGSKAYEEWLSSGVDPEIILANVEEIRGISRGYSFWEEDEINDCIEEIARLLNRDLDNASRLNNGRLNSSTLQSIEHYAYGGWWCSGIDVLSANCDEPDVFGCFKPNKPRIDKEKQKPLKYEHPYNMPTGIFALIPSVQAIALLWERYLEPPFASKETALNKAVVRSFKRKLKKLKENLKAGKLSKEEYVLKLEKAIKLAEEAMSANKAKIDFERDEIRSQLTPKTFWKFILNHPEIPIILCEGAKKAAALLSAGYAAIGIPGIWNAYRKEDEFGLSNPRIIERVQIFLNSNEGKTREVIFCFDCEDPYLKQKTFKNVQVSIIKQGELIIKKYKCKVSVMQWNYEYGKGIDDYLMNIGVHEKQLTTWEDLIKYGREKVEFMYNIRYSYDGYKNETYCDIRPFVSKLVEQKYLNLEEIEIPQDANLLVIKGAQRTGKTEAIARYLNTLRESGLLPTAKIITHRIKLNEELRKRIIGAISKFHLKKYEEAGKTPGGVNCFDSEIYREDEFLYSNPEKRFESQSGQYIILDEFVQSLLHLLTSSTEVSNRLIEVIKTFSERIQVALSTGGRIILLDADMTKFAVDFIKNLAGDDCEVKPFIIENKYLPNKVDKRNLHLYTGQTGRTAILKKLLGFVKEGKKALIHVDSQKASGKLSTQSLEALILKINPVAKILRVDMDTAALIKIEDLRDMLKTGEYDYVLLSPTVETGVSIDVYGVFDAVFGIFYGKQTVEGAFQSLERLRDNCPRYVWANKKAIIHNYLNPTTATACLKEEHQKNCYVLSELKKSNPNMTNIVDALNPDSLNNKLLWVWGIYQAKHNIEADDYYTSFLRQGTLLGYTIICEEGIHDTEIDNFIKKSWEIFYEAHNEKVSEQTLLSDEEFEELEASEETKAKFPHRYKKNKVYRLYAKKLEVTPELLVANDRQFYPKMKLLYYFSLGQLFSETKAVKRVQNIATKKYMKPINPKNQKDWEEQKIFKPNFNKKLSWYAKTQFLKEFLSFLNPNGIPLLPENFMLSEKEALELHHLHEGVAKEYFAENPDKVQGESVVLSYLQYKYPHLPLFSSEELKQTKWWQEVICNKEKCYYFKLFFKIAINPDKISPIQLAQNLLELVGLKLTTIASGNKIGCANSRTRLYTLPTLMDEYKEVFALTEPDEKEFLQDEFNREYDTPEKLLYEWLAEDVHTLAIEQAKKYLDAEEHLPIEVLHFEALEILESILGARFMELPRKFFSQEMLEKLGFDL